MLQLKKIREEMTSRDLDAVIVFDELNQKYLSGFAFTDGFLLITDRSAHLVTDFRYYEMATKVVSSDWTIHTPDDRHQFLINLFKNEDVKCIGFEGGFVSYDRYKYYEKNYPDQCFINIDNMIETLRQIKSPEEMKKMQKAQDITDAAFSHVLKMLTPYMTELDVAVELEYAMRKAGADGFAFETIAVSGDASALPHGTPRNIKLQKGFLTMDFGAKLDGYCSDMTRTVVVGKADTEMRKLYNTVLTAQLAAINFIKEGCDAGEADKVARDIIDAVPEFNGAFGHSLGHSVGLFIHEQPSMSKRAFGRLLRAGEIVTVEPGIYLFGKYGCRIEDMVAVTVDGVANFTHSTKELIEI